MKRVVARELLDEDLGTPAEVAASLRDLQRINDWFGGTRTTVQLLRHIAQTMGRGSLSLLEVGAGNGHVPIAARERLAQQGIELCVTLLDRVASHLPQTAVDAVVGDALQLPFPTKHSMWWRVTCWPIISTPRPWNDSPERRYESRGSQF